MQREEVENARKEAERLINERKWSQAEMCLKEALEAVGAFFKRASEFVTDIATGPIEDLLYGVDQTEQARRKRIGELANDPREHVRRGLARVLRTSDGRGIRTWP